jgi:hypothetical protein
MKAMMGEQQLCPYYLRDSYKCTLTGKSCLCEEPLQGHCLRKIWALKYQANCTGQPLPVNPPN